MKLTISVLACVALAGCMTPQITPHLVRFESQPAGATVQLTTNQRGTYTVCAPTPCIGDVRDDFGFLSTYTFTATLSGYSAERVVIQEPTLMHAQGIIPSVVRFNFK